MIIDEAVLDEQLAQLNSHRADLVAELNHTVGAIDALQFLKSKTQSTASVEPIGESNAQSATHD